MDIGPGSVLMVWDKTSGVTIHVISCNHDHVFFSALFFFRRGTNTTTLPHVPNVKIDALVHIATAPLGAGGHSDRKCLLSQASKSLRLRGGEVLERTSSV